LPSIPAKDVFRRPAAGLLGDAAELGQRYLAPDRNVREVAESVDLRAFDGQVG
jgi:hypothetical protein